MAEHPRATAYRALLVAQVRAQTQYRFSFWLDAVSSSVVSLLDIVAVLVLFRATPALGGFSVRQCLLIAALGNVAFSLADASVGNIDTMRQYIRTGRLDSMLLRPMGVLPQLVFGDFAPRRLGRVLQSCLVLAGTLIWLDPQWTVGRVVLVVAAPLAGAVIFASVFVAGSTVAFWFVESGEFANAFTYGGRDFTLYPISIYPGWFRKIFAYGLGFAFVAYYPGLALLGVADPLGAPAALAWCSPLIAVPAVLAAALVWRVGVRHYRSTGS